jgi:hypothetical protein
VTVRDTEEKAQKKLTALRSRRAGGGKFISGSPG